MAITVRDFKNAMSRDFEFLYIVDKNGRAWDVKKCPRYCAIMLDIQGFDDSYYIQAVRDNGDLVLSGSVAVDPGLTLVYDDVCGADLILSGCVINGENYYSTM